MVGKWGFPLRPENDCAAMAQEQSCVDVLEHRRVEEQLAGTGAQLINDLSSSTLVAVLVPFLRESGRN